MLSRRILLLFSLTFIVFIYLFSFASTSDARIPAPPGDQDLGGQDMTIFRTVDTLSCHIQNPLAMEMPIYVGIKQNYFPESGVSTALKNKWIANNHPGGACLGIHLKGEPNFFSKSYDGIGNDGTGRRGYEPYRHYLVIEVPNPAYCDPNNPSCDPTAAIEKFYCEKRNADCQAKIRQYKGKYIHWEGMVNIFQIAVSDSQGSEVWYVKELRRNKEMGKSQFSQIRIAGEKYKFPTRPAGYNLDVYGARMVNGYKFIWSTCEFNNPSRPGDDGLPCLNFTLDFDKTTTGAPNTIWNNPNIYLDVPHNATGKPLGWINFYNGTHNWVEDGRTGWVRCKNRFSELLGSDYNTYINSFSSISSSTAPYQPTDCAYAPITEAVSNQPPVETMLRSWYTPGIDVGNPSPTPTPTPGQPREERFLKAALAPVNGSNAAGTARVLLSRDHQSIKVVANFTGLTANVETAAHIHGPRPSTAAVWTLPPSTAVPSGRKIEAEFQNITNQQYQDFVAGKYYINVHSSTYPNGEISGDLSITHRRKGDINGDNTIDVLDYTTIISDFSRQGNYFSDIIDSAPSDPIDSVDLLDYTAVINCFLKDASVCN